MVQLIQLKASVEAFFAQKKPLCRNHHQRKLASKRAIAKSTPLKNKTDRKTAPKTIRTA
jgi:hypothetical protein